MHLRISTIFFWCAILAFVLFLRPPQATAQKTSEEFVSEMPATVLSDKAPYVLTYDHLSRNARLQSNTGETLESWPHDMVPIAALPPDRPLVVRIENANSLLYNYSLNASVVRTKQLKTCSNLGKSAGSFGALQNILGLQSAGMGLVDMLPSIIGIEMPEAEEDFFDRSGDETRSISELTLTRTMNNISGDLHDYSELLEQIISLSESVQESLQEIAMRAEVEPIDVMLAQLQENVEGIRPGFSDPIRLPTIVAGAADDVSTQLSSLTFISTTLDENGYDGQMTDPIVRDVRALAARLRGAHSGISEALPVLQIALNVVQNARVNSEQRFNLSASDASVRQLALQLSATDEFESILRFRTGTVMFYSEPRSSLLCHLAVGVAFVDEPPVYDSTDGVISNTAGSDSRIGVNLLLHFSSDNFPLVGGLLGIGLGDGNSPDFYAGGSIRLLDPIMINVGAVWQRIPQLPGDTRVGNTGVEAFLNDDLSKRYEPELFFGISFAR